MPPARCCPGHGRGLQPALIEKVRTVVTDGEGRYNIVDLRPGSYTVTFSITGFNAFRRDGIELPSGFTATVNADMKIGALSEPSRSPESRRWSTHVTRASRRLFQMTCSTCCRAA